MNYNWKHIFNYNTAFKHTKVGYKMIKPTVYTWGTAYSPEQVIQRRIPDYTSLSQVELDEAVGKLNDGIKKNKITPLIGLGERDTSTERRMSLINGCLVTLGENRDPRKNVYLHILAEPSNKEGLSKTLDYFCLHL